MQILKCVSCYHENAQREKTLPVICPNSHMPCFAFEPKNFKNGNFDKIMKEICELDCNKKLTENQIPRIPLDNKYIDIYFKKRMEDTFEDCKLKNIEVKKIFY